jgi:hypothetical protein
MKALTLKELALELGDILVCESQDSCMFTYGSEYEVELSEDGKLGVNTDCGFHATTSASIFTKITITHSDSKPSSGKLNEWAIHNVKRIKVPSEVVYIGGYRNVGRTALTYTPEHPLQPELVETRH